MEEEERIQREAEEMQVKKRYVRRLFIQDLSNHVVAFKEFHNNNSKIVPKLATGVSTLVSLMKLYFSHFFSRILDR